MLQTSYYKTIYQNYNTITFLTSLRPASDAYLTSAYMRLVFFPLRHPLRRLSWQQESKHPLLHTKYSFMHSNFFKCPL